MNNIIYFNDEQKPEVIIDKNGNKKVLFAKEFNKRIKLVSDSFPRIEQVSDNLKYFSEELKKTKSL